MNRNNKEIGNFSIGSTLSQERKRQIYNETLEAKKRAREFFRLRNEEWYKQLNDLFKVHQEKSDETFLKPDDCPVDVWKQFCEDKKEEARGQGVDAIEEIKYIEERPPSSGIELADADNVVPVELDKLKEFKLNTILMEDEARAESLERIRNSPEYQALLEQYQSGETSREEFEQAVKDLRSDYDILSQATRVLVYDIKMGIVHLPDVAIQPSSEPETKIIDQKGDKERGVVFKFSKTGVTVKPREEKKDKFIAETFYNPAELKAASDWLKEKVTLTQEKNYAELRAQERDAADERLLDNTKEVWQYFIESKKWAIDEKGKKINIENKGDIDAKITLGMLRQAGLEEKIYKYIKQDKTKNQITSSAEASWSGLEIGKGGMVGFDQGLSFPKQKACAAEIVYKLLLAGGVYKKDDEAPRIAAELAHRAVYNELLTNKEELINSDKTMRGLVRFFDYGNLFAYLRNNWVNVKGKTWDKKLNNLFDRELERKDLEHYFIKKDDRGKNIIDYQKEQAKIIEQAKIMLKKSTEELKTEGRIVESPVWGKVFVNVMNSSKDNFPGGASSVAAYGAAGAYLNIDLEKNSFLFRPFGEISKEQKAKLNIPGGSWAYNMYFKPRGDKLTSLNKEEIFKQLEIAEIPTSLTDKLSPTESTPINLPAPEVPERDEEIEKKVTALRSKVEQVWQQKSTESKYADYLGWLSAEARAQWLKKQVDATLELYRKDLHAEKINK